MGTSRVIWPFDCQASFKLWFVVNYQFFEAHFLSKFWAGIFLLFPLDHVNLIGLVLFPQSNSCHQPTTAPSYSFFRFLQVPAVLLRNTGVRCIHTFWTDQEGVQEVRPLQRLQWEALRLRWLYQVRHPLVMRNYTYMKKRKIPYRVKREINSWNENNCFHSN